MWHWVHLAIEADQPEAIIAGQLGQHLIDTANAGFKRVPRTVYDVIKWKEQPRRAYDEDPIELWLKNLSQAFAWPTHSYDAGEIQLDVVLRPQKLQVPEDGRWRIVNEGKLLDAAQACSKLAWPHEQFELRKHNLIIDISSRQGKYVGTIQETILSTQMKT